MQHTFTEHLLQAAIAKAFIIRQVLSMYLPNIRMICL